MKKAGILGERLLRFSVGIGQVVNALPGNRMGRHIAGQLVRCGTSPGANYEEACEAESRADFIHKISLCQKELRESRYWLPLLLEAKILPPSPVRNLERECLELCRIFARSLLTAKTNSQP